MRLRLRSWTLADVDAARPLWGDPEVMKMMVGDVAKTDADVRAALRYEMDRLARHAVQAWAVELIETGEVVGACGFHPFDGGPALEMTFRFAKAHWGKGYATEAGSLAVERARALRPPKIVAGTFGDHPSSARVLEKLGFVRKGEIIWPDNLRSDPYYELPLIASPAP